MRSLQSCKRPRHDQRHPSRHRGNDNAISFVYDVLFPLPANTLQNLSGCGKRETLGMPGVTHRPRTFRCQTAGGTYTITAWTHHDSRRGRIDCRRRRHHGVSALARALLRGKQTFRHEPPWRPGRLLFWPFVATLGGTGARPSQSQLIANLPAVRATSQRGHRVGNDGTNLSPQRLEFPEPQLIPTAVRY